MNPLMRRIATGFSSMTLRLETLRRFLFAIIVVGTVSAPSFSGEFNKVLKIGDPAPAFVNLPGTDGKTHSLSDFKDKDAVVIAITSNQCPVSIEYEDRIIALAKKHADKVAFVAICASLEPEDRLPEMTVRAKKKGFPYSYLYDESQAIGRALGASVTPEFFVLNKDRKIAYMGAFDDHLDEAKVKAKYLEPALEAILNGEAPEKKETQAEGCTLVYSNKTAAKPAAPAAAKVNATLRVVKFADVEADLKQRQGKIVVVDLWATWCVPCRKEFPGLVALHGKYAAKGVACVSVSLDDADDKDKAKAFLSNNGAAFTNFLIDDETKWKEKWNVGGIPIVLVFGPDGKLAKRFDNSDPNKPFAYTDVEATVQGLLKKKP
jgi:thiol-disulfide isomerase/thioredoxin